MNCRHYRNHCLDSNWQHSLCKAGAAICSLRHFWSPKPGKPMSGGFPGPLLVECVSTETVILLILPQQESGRTSDEGFCGNLWTIVFVLWVLHWKVMADLQLTFSLWPFLSTSLWHWREKKKLFFYFVKKSSKSGGGGRGEMMMKRGAVRGDIINFQWRLPVDADWPCRRSDRRV